MREVLGWVDPSPLPGSGTECVTCRRSEGKCHLYERNTAHWGFYPSETLGVEWPSKVCWKLVFSPLASVSNSRWWMCSRISTLSFQVQGVSMTSTSPSSALCQVWITLSSWNHFRALGYKDENPSCSLQLIPAQWGSGFEAVERQVSTLPEPTIIFCGGVGPWLQMYLWETDSGAATPFSVWLAMRLRWNAVLWIKNVCSQRPLIQHNQDWLLVGQFLKGRESGESYKIQTHAINILF